MLSDFLDGNGGSPAGGPGSAPAGRPALSFEDALKVAGKKHDMIGIKVYDKMDMQLPRIGMIEAEDSETGGRHWVDTNDYSGENKTTNNISLTRRSKVKAFFQKGRMRSPASADRRRLC